MTMERGRKNNDGLRIRPSRPDDAAMIADIFAANYMSYAHPDPELARDYGATADNLHHFVETSLRMRKGPAYWASYPEVAGNALFVATINDTIVGYTASNLSEAINTEEPRVAELDDLEVAVAARGYNVGTRLLDILVDYHENLGRLATFACFVGWANRGFYERYGAEMLGPINTAKVGQAVMHGIYLKLEGLAIFGPKAPTEREAREQLLVEVRQQLY